MVRLVVEPCVSATALDRGLSPGQADNHGTVDGDELVVEDTDAAAALVERYPNVRYADADTPGSGGDDAGDTPRMQVDNEGSRRVDDGASGEASGEPSGEESETVPLEDREYSELRTLAAEADTDAIDGRSSREAIIAHFSDSETAAEE